MAQEKGRGSTKVSADEQAVLNAMMEEDQQPMASADKLAVITHTAHELQRVEREVLTITEQLETKTKEKQKLEFDVLPALMDEVGLKDFTLDDGYKVERGEEVYASISKENAPVACTWLTKHGYGSIVKTVFTVEVPRGPEAPKVSAAIRKLLEKNQITFEYSAGVHPQTLKAFAKESIEASRKLSPAISVHQQPRVKLKAPKAKK